MPLLHIDFFEPVAKASSKPVHYSSPFELGSPMRVPITTAVLTSAALLTSIGVTGVARADIAPGPNTGFATDVWDEQNQCWFRAEVSTDDTGENIAIKGWQNPINTGPKISCGVKYPGGGLLTQIVCEKASSAVSNWAGASNFFSTASESWCYARIRFGSGALQSQYGTEYRFLWDPITGWHSLPQTSTEYNRHKRDGIHWPKESPIKGAPEIPDCTKIVDPVTTGEECATTYGAAFASDSSVGMADVTAMEGAHASELASIKDKPGLGYHIANGPNAACVEAAAQTAAWKTDHGYDATQWHTDKNPNSWYCYSYTVYAWNKPPAGG
ncbi:hypothetical protein [Streptomyces collinus]|uniref:hypothetical protein n=1 Tax=Streptomyces collinus TaxID=42684 RepID=UPI0036E95C15